MPILLTGGRGRLGTEIQKHLAFITPAFITPAFVAPTRQELDITDLNSLQRAFNTYQPSLIVHAAAYTHVSGAETDKKGCWEVNVLGTRNMVKVALEHAVPFIHISTDYVFYGDRGMYKEDDPVGPVRNYYALSKLVAEEIVRGLANHLVIRTSFRPIEWPYSTAFDDIYTSQDYVDIIAPEIILAIKKFTKIPFQTLHIATERKTVYDLAKRRKPDVIRGSKESANVQLPEDISLDISRWQMLKEHLREET